MTILSRRLIASWIVHALLLCSSAILGACPLRAEPPPDENLAKLATLDIDELLEQEVFSVSKKSERLSEAAAAIFVLTREDIRRSGANSIPEALRLVPELHVARINSHQWAISSRGFNGVYANKLLVLIDGRTVYNPLFSGVFWNVQDTMIEDIERIEVIRGPGATLWGANAVNGIINIITKNASDTRGGLASVTAGNEDHVIAGVRYGERLSDNTDARFFVRGFRRDEAKITDDGGYGDDWGTVRGGFRLDSRPTETDEISAQGEIYDGDLHNRTSRTDLTPPFFTFAEEDVTLTGRHIIGRWTRQMASDSEISLRGYFDSMERTDSFLDQDRDTYDVEIELRTTPLPSHEIVWGAGFRYIDDEYQARIISIVPERWNYDLYTAFVQDRISLSPDVAFIIGSKFEHNDFDGTAVQPSVRLSWTPSDDSMIWAAVSRASRSSSRAEEGIILDSSASPLPDGTILVNRIVGDPSHESESLNAYEAGVRSRLAKGAVLDVVGFYNDYPRLNSAEPGAPFPEDRNGSQYLVLPIVVSSKNQGESYGGAAVLTYAPFDFWRLQASYSHIRIHIDADEDSGDQIGEQTSEESPRNMVMLRSLLEFRGRWQFDSHLRYVDSVPGIDVDRYIELNARLGWEVSDSLDLSLILENILHEEHEEYISTFVTAQRGEIERAVSLRATYRF